MFTLSPELQQRLIWTLLLLLGAWLVRRLAAWGLEHTELEVSQRFRLRKVVDYIVGLVCVLALGRIWLVNFGSLATFLGLLSAGLAIALREPLVNLAGWLFIVWRQPYRVGDRVQIGTVAGDVIDIRLFQTVLLEVGGWVAADQSTGRLLHVPNQRIFSETVANFTKGFTYIWDELPVVITFESNWEKARRILRAVVEEYWRETASTAEAELKRAARRHYILYPTLTPIVYLDVVEYGVRLTLRYLAPARQRRAVAQRMWEAILQAFGAEPDIDLAYPTQRVYFNPVEGKHVR